jgi:hypothetical protein
MACVLLLTYKRSSLRETLRALATISTSSVSCSRARWATSSSSAQLSPVASSLTSVTRPIIPARIRRVFFVVGVARGTFSQLDDLTPELGHDVLDELALRSVTEGSRELTARKRSLVYGRDWPVTACDDRRLPSRRGEGPDRGRQLLLTD